MLPVGFDSCIKVYHSRKVSTFWLCEYKCVCLYSRITETFWYPNNFIGPKIYYDFYVNYTSEFRNFRILKCNPGRYLHFDNINTILTSKIQAVKTLTKIVKPAAKFHFFLTIGYRNIFIKTNQYQYQYNNNNFSNSVNLGLRMKTCLDVSGITVIDRSQGLRDVTDHHEVVRSRGRRC